MILDRALDTKTDEIVALKKMRMENEKDGKTFLISVLRRNKINVLILHDLYYTLVLDCRQFVLFKYILIDVYEGQSLFNNLKLKYSKNRSGNESCYNYHKVLCALLLTCLCLFFC